MPPVFFCSRWMIVQHGRASNKDRVHPPQIDDVMYGSTLLLSIEDAMDRISFVNCSLAPPNCGGFIRGRLRRLADDDVKEDRKRSCGCILRVWSNAKCQWMHRTTIIAAPISVMGVGRVHLSFCFWLLLDDCTDFCLRFPSLSTCVPFILYCELLPPRHIIGQWVAYARNVVVLFYLGVILIFVLMLSWCI